MIEIVVAPMQPFLAMPWLALLPAVAFAAAWWWRRRPTAAMAALLWFAYALWEISFLVRPVREWIRIDLIAIAPILAVVTVTAAVVLWKSGPRGRNT